MSDTGAASSSTPAAAEAAAAPPAPPALEERSFITVVLDQASLETVKMKSGQYCLLNCDDHSVGGAIVAMGERDGAWGPD